MNWTPWAILSFLGLEALGYWIARHAVRVEEYELRPEFRFVQWGSHMSTDLGSWDEWTMRRRWFLVIKLPSYQWGRLDYGRREGWVQLHLIWEEGNGWGRTGYWP